MGTVPAVTMRRRPSAVLSVLLLPLVLAAAGEAPRAPAPAIAPIPALAAGDGADAAAGQEQIAALSRATPVRLGGGATSLAVAVTLLSASGNPTLLADNVDGAISVVLPPLDGTYWQALLAVCAAFDLGIAMSPVVGSDGGPTGAPGFELHVPVQAGPVWLCRRAQGTPRLLAEAQGPLAVVVEELQLNQARSRTTGDPLERWVDVSLRLVLEPHVAAGSIGQAELTLAAHSALAGKELAMEAIEQGHNEAHPDTRYPGSFRLILPRFPGISAFRLSGLLTLPVGEATTLAGTLRLGTAQELVHGHDRLTVRLIDGEAAKRESRRGPGLLCTYAAGALVAEPVLHVAVAGQELPGTEVVSERHDDDIELTMLFGSEPAAQEHAVEVHASFERGHAALPLSWSIDLGALPAGDAELDQPSSLSRATLLAWPAGTITLQQALQRLRASGNLVLLELGADEMRSSELPAFSGSFWDGVLAVCHAFQLTVLVGDGSEAVSVPDDDSSGGLVRSVLPIDGGTVCLGQERTDRPALSSMQACGPLLAMITDSESVLTRGRLGVERTTNLACRLRLEPRLHQVRLRNTNVYWYAFAEAAGRSLPVRRPLLDPRDPESADGAAAIPLDGKEVQLRTSPWVVAVGGLPAGATRLSLGGLFVGELEQPVQVALALSPGQRQAVRLGEHVLEVSFLDQAQARVLGLSDAAVSIDGSDALGHELKCELRGPLGERLQPFASEGVPQHPFDFVRVYKGIIDARYQLLLSADVSVTRLSLPIAVATDQP
jgi:hypothetical protein